MKKSVSVCVILLLCVLMTGCGGGRISSANIEIGESSVYTEDELDNAVDIVLDYFSEEF